MGPLVDGLLLLVCMLFFVDMHGSSMLEVIRNCFENYVTCKTLNASVGCSMDYFCYLFFSECLLHHGAGRMDVSL